MQDLRDALFGSHEAEGGEEALDVLEELKLMPAGSAAELPEDDDAQTHEGEAATDDEDPLLAALGFDASSLDALQARTGLPTPHLQAQLLTLELDGKVARLPGGLFQRMAAS